MALAAAMSSLEKLENSKSKVSTVRLAIGVGVGFGVGVGDSLGVAVGLAVAVASEAGVASEVEAVLVSSFLEVRWRG